MLPSTYWEVQKGGGSCDFCAFSAVFFSFSHTVKLGQKCKLQKNTIEIFYYTATSFQLKEISGEENSGQLRIL